jgi:hypothetical protein
MLLKTSEAADQQYKLTVKEHQAFQQKYAEDMKRILAVSSSYRFLVDLQKAISRNGREERRAGERFAHQIPFTTGE